MAADMVTSTATAVIIACCLVACPVVLERQQCRLSRRPNYAPECAVAHSHVCVVSRCLSRRLLNRPTGHADYVLLINFCSSINLSKKHTLPSGNFFRKSSVLLVSPNVNSGGSDATLIFAPLYCAAISALYARKFSGKV